jgi:hypothetical protein
LSEKKLVYSREDLLSLYSPNLPLPVDFDSSLGSFTEEKQPPLAMIPLNDHEKRVT